MNEVESPYRRTVTMKTHPSSVTSLSRQSEKTPVAVSADACSGPGIGILMAVFSVVCLSVVSLTSVYAQEEEETFRPRNSWGQRGERPGARLPGAKWGENLPGAQELIERLRMEDPERFEHLMTLREQDRPAFMQELRQIVKERRGAGDEKGRKPPSPQEIRCNELSRQYQEAETEEKKAEIKAELEQAVMEAFEARLNASKERLARLESEITAFREHIKRIEGNREKMVQMRVDELTRPPELDWDSRW